MRWKEYDMTDTSGQSVPDLFLWYATAEHELPQHVGELYWATLSIDERERNARLANEADRRIHLLAHAMKRAALTACRPEVAPGTWRFGHTHEGKPFVLEVDPAPCFNISHTRHAAACVVTMSGPAGVDIEPLSRGAEILRVLPRFANPDELAALASPEDAVWLWTGKEAIAKASGAGLAAMREDRSGFHVSRWVLNHRYALSVAASAPIRSAATSSTGCDQLAIADL